MTTRTIRIPWPGRRMTLALAALSATALAVTTAGCTSANGNNTEHAQQIAGVNLLEQNQPLPIFGTSAMRQELIQIEAIQALGTPTTTFFFPPGQGPGTGAGPIKTCPSQGEPIPNTASLSNPHQVASNGNGAVIDQMDPNGTYAPASSSGTYVLCVTPGGGVKLTYWEGDVFAESGTAVWNATTRQIEDAGPSQLPACTRQVAASGDGSGVSAGTSYYHCTKT